MIHSNDDGSGAPTRIFHQVRTRQGIIKMNKDNAPKIKAHGPGARALAEQLSQEAAQVGKPMEVVTDFSGYKICFEVDGKEMLFEFDHPLSLEEDQVTDLVIKGCNCSDEEFESVKHEILVDPGVGEHAQDFLNLIQACRSKLNQLADEPESVDLSATTVSSQPTLEKEITMTNATTENFTNETAMQQAMNEAMQNNASQQTTEASATDSSTKHENVAVEKANQIKENATGFLARNKKKLLVAAVVVTGAAAGFLGWKYRSHIPGLDTVAEPTSEA
jgi:hypothetical protein